MSIIRPNTLIPYIMAYLIHNFYNSKTTYDRQNQLHFWKSA